MHFAYAFSQKLEERAIVLGFEVIFKTLLSETEVVVFRFPLI